MKKLSLLAMLMLAFSIQANAGEIEFKGFFQEWFSYTTSNDTNSYGFSLRRLRIKGYGNLSKKIDWYVQFAYDQQKPKLLDAAIYFKISKPINIKVGQFKIPGSDEGLISSSKLDFVERAMVVQNWGTNNHLSSYRNIGLCIEGELFDNKFYYAIMIANLKADKVFTPQLKDFFYDEQKTMQISSRIEIRPTDFIKVGGFYLSASNFGSQKDYESHGIHGSIKSSYLNVKTEYISGINTTISEGPRIKYNGWFFLVGYQTGQVEPIVRYDYYQYKVGSNILHETKYNNFTLGANYHLSKKIKIQANYVLRHKNYADITTNLNNSIFYTNLQYIF